MIPDGLQGAVVSPLHERVGAFLVGIAPGVELLRGHVRGVEAGAFGPGAVSGQEGLPVDAVPGTVVDAGIEFFGRVRQGAEEGLSVSEILLPIDLVHLVGGFAIQFQDFFSVVGDSRQVRGRERPGRGASKRLNSSSC